MKSPPGWTSCCTEELGLAETLAHGLDYSGRRVQRAKKKVLYKEKKDFCVLLRHFPFIPLGLSKNGVPLYYKVQFKNWVNVTSQDLMMVSPSTCLCVCACECGCSPKHLKTAAGDSCTGSIIIPVV